MHNFADEPRLLNDIMACDTQCRWDIRSTKRKAGSQKSTKVYFYILPPTNPLNIYANNNQIES